MLVPHLHASLACCCSVDLCRLTWCLCRGEEQLLSCQPEHACCRSGNIVKPHVGTDWEYKVLPPLPSISIWLQRPAVVRPEGGADGLPPISQLSDCETRGAFLSWSFSFLVLTMVHNSYLLTRWGPVSIVTRSAPGKRFVNCAVLYKWDVLFLRPILFL